MPVAHCIGTFQQNLACLLILPVKELTCFRHAISPVGVVCIHTVTQSLTGKMIDIVPIAIDGNHNPLRPTGQGSITSSISSHMTLINYYQLFFIFSLTKNRIL